MAKIIRLAQLAVSVIFIILVLVTYMLLTCETRRCGESGHNLSPPTGLNKLVDCGFLNKLLWNLDPFSDLTVRINFYLYKRAFPVCGPQIRLDDDSLLKSGLNISHPTRLIIHGWMGQSSDPINRNIKDAYLSIGDFNVIVVDWSSISTSLNYFGIVDLIDRLGGIVANFTRHLHNTVGVDYDDMYLIGHSLGAQIAGSAGKQIYPAKFNTIFALDPAGPGFRRKSKNVGIHSTDAKYVESIQTSVKFGLMQPVGHATFFPNKGVYQRCWGLTCSHSRAHRYFAESISSTRGFWGYLCDEKERLWHCPEKGVQYQMGGEPSQPKTGTFYVETNRSPPYALGRTYT